MSERPAYRALAKVLSILLPLVGIGLLFGANYAQSYVHDQLAQEKITMPDQKGIDALKDDAAKNALKPYIGQQMTNGPQARDYANHYIYEHMKSACNAVKTSDGKTLQIPADQCTYAGIGDFAKKYDAKSPEGVALAAARDSNFKGDSLRSMLLTAYAFWLVGEICKWLGIALILGGILAGLLGWWLLRDKDRHVDTVHTTPVRDQVVTSHTENVVPAHTTNTTMHKVETPARATDTVVDQKVTDTTVDPNRKF